MIACKACPIYRGSGSMPPQETFKIISFESGFQWYFSYHIAGYIDVSSYIIKGKRILYVRS